MATRKPWQVKGFLGHVFCFCADTSGAADAQRAEMMHVAAPVTACVYAPRESVTPVTPAP